MTLFGRFVIWGLTSLFTATLIGLISAIGLFYYFSEDLPDYTQLKNYDPPRVSRLYAGDGRLLAEYATQKRVYVSINAMPDDLTNAFIAAEDKNFYTHPGVDLVGIARAVVENLTNIGSNRRLVGGSTITQQVVKNMLLTNEQSLTRKVKEAILAFRVSNIISKEKILELYLNEIFLGKRSYGVAAAALNYFNKSMDELTLAESAFLAALPKAPNNYNPNRHYDRAKNRRDWILRRMHTDGYITEEEMLSAQATPIELKKPDATQVTKADFFAEDVRRELVNMYGEDVLYEGGLFVMTTLDPSLQSHAEFALSNALRAYDQRHGYRGPLTRVTLGKYADWQALLKNANLASVEFKRREYPAIVLSTSVSKATIGLKDGSKGTIPLDDVQWARKPIQRGLFLGDPITSVKQVMKPGDIIIAKSNGRNMYSLRQLPEINGAMVVIDPHTGRVLAMVGGYSSKRSEFNRATQARRQPGSSFKPFVYLTALENGFAPSSIVLDEPIELEQGPDLPLWSPKNYGDEYYGPRTLRFGIEKSLNAMTVHLAQMISLERIAAMGKRFGIYDDLPLIHSVVLGSQEVDLLTITNAYSSFVNGGKKVTSSLIERIDDRHGRTIYRRDRRNCNWCDLLGYDIPEGHPLPPPLQTDNRKQLIDPRLAYQMTSILEGVVQRGSAIRARWQVDKPVAGKTGTTNETRDAWFIGYSPNLVVGVYTGFDTPRTLGEKETGSSVALPAFITFMQNTLKNEPSIPFRTPPGIQLVKIDRFSGLPPSGYGEEEIIQEAFVTGEELFIPDDAKAMVEDLPPVITDAYSFVNSDPYNLNPSYQQSLTPEDRFFKQIIPSAPSVVSPPTYESPTPGDWPSPSAGQSPQPEPKKRTPLTGTGGIY